MKLYKIVIDSHNHIGVDFWIMPQAITLMRKALRIYKPKSQ